MPTFTKKANGKWLVQVRHKAQNGKPPINKSATFDRKAAAQAWASKEVTPSKRGHKSETLRLNQILRSPLAKVMLQDLTEVQLKE